VLESRGFLVGDLRREQTPTTPRISPADHGGNSDEGGGHALGDARGHDARKLHAQTDRVEEHEPEEHLHERDRQSGAHQRGQVLGDELESGATRRVLGGHRGDREEVPDRDREDDVHERLEPSELLQSSHLGR
jgi:hypothetical protein